MKLKPTVATIYIESIFTNVYCVLHNIYNLKSKEKSRGINIDLIAAKAQFFKRLTIGKVQAHKSDGLYMYTRSVKF